MRFPVNQWIAALAHRCLPPHCVLCGGPGQPPALDLCRDCAAELPRAAAADDGVVAVFDYAQPVDHLIHELKYRGRLAVGRVLGTLLAETPEVRHALQAADCIVPVPLHPSRAAERGFNQSAEIARWLARPPECVLMTQGLARVRATAAQVGLSGAARRRNLQDAFLASAAMAGRRVALLDDVVTSGGTLAAATAALQAAGADVVSILAVARAAVR